MSDAVFVTHEGFADLRKDMEDSELSVTEYWKLVVTKRDGDSMIAVRRIIQCIDAWIEGRTTQLMREWRNHRRAYSDLTNALGGWR